MESSIRRRGDGWVEESKGKGISKKKLREGKQVM